MQSLFVLLSALVISGCDSFKIGEKPKPQYLCVEEKDAKDLKKICSQFKGEIKNGVCIPPEPEVPWSKISKNWKDSCQGSGGTVTSFEGHDNSQDKCQLEKTSQISPTADIIPPIEACDCGPSKCWFEKEKLGTCVENPVWLRSYDKISNQMVNNFLCPN